MFKFKLEKAQRGEHFDGLDLVTKLLTPSVDTNKRQTTQLIEEIELHQGLDSVNYAISSGSISHLFYSLLSIRIDRILVPDFMSGLFVSLIAHFTSCSIGLFVSSYKLKAHMTNILINVSNPKVRNFHIKFPKSINVLLWYRSSKLCYVIDKQCFT